MLRKSVLLRTVSRYSFCNTNHQPTSTTTLLHNAWKIGRYDKPIGAVLLHMPCIWGTILGQPSSLIVLWFSGVFGFGAFVMRAAGCIINDICDKDIDVHVERTKLRPLAAGTLSLNQALAILFAHLSLGLLVLTQLSPPAIAASFAVMPIVCLYPLTKRFFSYPQFVLGLAFNWGILIAGIQTASALTPPLLTAYFGAVLHTVIYDTIYAHQDKQFDQQLNLYSTAYTLPHQTPLYLTTPFTASLMAASYLAGYHWITYPGFLMFQVLLWRRIKSCDFSDPRSCGEFFKDFKYYQLFVAAIFGIGSYLRE